MKKAEAPVERNAEESTPSDLLAPDPSSEPGKEASFRELANCLELEEGEFLELLSLFLETGSAELEKMRSALAEGNASKAFQSAHSLKGTAATLGLREIYELAKGIEANAHSNDLSGAEDRAGAIQGELNRYRDLLN